MGKIFVINNDSQPEAVTTVCNRFKHEVRHLGNIRDIVLLVPPLSEKDCILVVDSIEGIEVAKLAFRKIRIIACMKNDKDYARARVAGASVVFGHRGDIAEWLSKNSVK